MRIRRTRQGVSSVEFGLVAPLIAFLAVNVFDMAIYFYSAMQVANAAEMVAQAAWEACDPNIELPATVRCSGLNAAVNASARSSTLGGQVRLVSGYPQESYYCLIGGALQRLDVPLEPKPDNCAALDAANVKPGDYIEVRVSYDYTPILSWSIAALWPDPIVRSAMIRLL